SSRLLLAAAGGSGCHEFPDRLRRVADRRADLQVLRTLAPEHPPAPHRTNRHSGNARHVVLIEKRFQRFSTLCLKFASLGDTALMCFHSSSFGGWLRGLATKPLSDGVLPSQEKLDAENVERNGEGAEKCRGAPARCRLGYGTLSQSSGVVP